MALGKGGLAAVASGLAIVALLAPASVAARPPVLGKKGLMPYGKGWGTAHPAFIFNGGVPAGSVSHVRWRHWGAGTATGTGRAPQYRPEGGYYAKRVRVKLRAMRLGRCPGAGRRAYTRLLYRKQTRPGGPFSDWAPWTLDLCNFDAQPAPCPPLSFAPDNGDGASEIVAWDMSCTTARAVAAGAKAIRFDPGPHAGGMATYRMHSRGFACSGWSSDDGQPQQIFWSCLRGTAVVRFAAIVTRDYGPSDTCTKKVVAGVGEAISDCFRVSAGIARSTTRVRINGIDLEPVDGAEVAIDLRDKVLSTRGEVEIHIGFVPLGRHHVRFDLARSSTYVLKEDKGPPRQIAGLALKGSGELRFEDGATVAKLSVELPALVKGKAKHRKAKERPTVEIAMKADNVKGLRLETLGGEWSVLRLPGHFELTDVKLKYADRGFEGAGTLWLGGVNPKGIEAKVKIAAGGVFEVSAAVENLNKRLWNVIYLQKVGFAFAVRPFNLGAAVGVTGGPQIKLPGRPPFRVSRVDGELSWTNDNPDTWKITGTGKFVLADFDGELTIATTGKADLKGDTAFTAPFAEKYGLRGHVEGWLEGDQLPDDVGGGGGGSWDAGAALLQGRVHLSMPGLDAGKADAVLSNVGVAACRRGIGPDFGFGYTWGGDLDVMARSCGLGRWTPARPHASAAQTDGAVTVRLPRPRRVFAVRLDGAAGAPVVNVTGPHGLRVDTLPGPDASTITRRAAVVKDSDRHVTYIAIDRAPRGTYTFTPAAGSPAVAAAQTARALPLVRIRARVRGHALRYRIAGLAGGRVLFAEQGRDVRSAIGSTRRRHGTLRFRPAAGTASRRRVIAVVMRDGRMQATRIVARFRAQPTPRPRRPRGLRIRAKHSRAAITWRGRAARYEVRVQTSDGRSLEFRASSRRKRVIVGALARRTRMRVTVRGIDALGRRGPAAQASFRRR